MKRFLFRLLYTIGLTSFARWWNRRRVIFLCYHGATQRPERDPQDPHGLHVRVDRFETHLEHLRRHFRVISLAEYLSGREGGAAAPERAVVITFDDAYRNFLSAAWPILKRFEMPVTVFPIVDRIESEPNSPREPNWSPVDDTRFLSWDEVRDLALDPQLTFGSHTCSHPRLTELSRAECERELRLSLSAMASILGESTRPLAYPWGDHADWVGELAQQVGYSCAVTTSGAPNRASSDLFALGRVLIGDDDDLAAFAVRVSGLRHWLDRGRSIFLTPRRRLRTETAPSALGQIRRIP
jgi:peptidoglycan/xylan/chitin deacetylase (PgdA/CDA1 family)